MGPGVASAVNDVGGIAFYDRDLSESGINNLGQTIGGRGYLASDGYIETNGRLTSLSALAPSGYANPTGINNLGQVVGFEMSGTKGAIGGLEHAFLYSDGKLVDLGLSGRTAATSINDHGQIVGTSYTTGDAFLYSGGAIHDLGKFDGFGARPNAINNLGQIVGGADSGKAFLYEGGHFLNLNDLISPTLGLSLNFASGINDRGQIAVSATDAQGNVHALRLDPVGVPEPASLASFALVAVCCIARRWRPRRSA